MDQRNKTSLISSIAIVGIAASVVIGGSCLEKRKNISELAEYFDVPRETIVEYFEAGVKDYDLEGLLELDIAPEVLRSLDEEDADWIVYGLNQKATFEVGTDGRHGYQWFDPDEYMKWHNAGFSVDHYKEAHSHDLSLEKLTDIAGGISPRKNKDELFRTVLEFYSFLQFGIKDPTERLAYLKRGLEDQEIRVLKNTFWEQTEDIVSQSRDPKKLCSKIQDGSLDEIEYLSRSYDLKRDEGFVASGMSIPDYIVFCVEHNFDVLSDEGWRSIGVYAPDRLRCQENDISLKDAEYGKAMGLTVDKMIEERKGYLFGKHAVEN